MGFVESQFDEHSVMVTSAPNGTFKPTVSLNEKSRGCLDAIDAVSPPETHKAGEINRRTTAVRAGPRPINGGSSASDTPKMTTAAEKNVLLTHRRCTWLTSVMSKPCHAICHPQDCILVPGNRDDDAYNYSWYQERLKLHRNLKQRA